MKESDTFTSLKLKRKKKKCLSCAKINKYFIFPFLSPIFIFIRDVLLDQAKIKTNGLRQILQYDLYDGLMHSSCIFLYIIEYIRIGKQQKKEKKNEENNEINLIELKKKKTLELENKKINKLEIFFIILTIGFGLNNYISSKMNLQNVPILETRVYHVIFNAIFCRFILGYKVYKHQLLSIILILVGWVLISIPIYLQLTVDVIYYNVLFFFFAIFYPLYLALLKYISEKYFISIYLYMFFIGLALIIISIILTLITSFLNYSNFSDLINIFDFTNNKLLFSFAIVSGAIVKFILCITIQNFSPNIFILTNVISSIMKWIYNVSYKREYDSKLNIICLSIGYFIFLISCLIYNEIIILNFCNLNENTNYDINERLLIDNELSDFDKEEKEYVDIGDYLLPRQPYADKSLSNKKYQYKTKYFELLPV